VKNRHLCEIGDYPVSFVKVFQLNCISMQTSLYTAQMTVREQSSKQINHRKNLKKL